VKGKSNGDGHWFTETCTVLIKVSNALQCIYPEFDSQLIFLNFKAGFGN